MAEASIAAFGVAIGMAIALAVTCFVIRGKGHHDEIPFTPLQNRQHLNKLLIFLYIGRPHTLIRYDR